MDTVRAGGRQRPDHEPLVVDVEPIGWLSPTLLDEAKRRYHERFDVGRDSTG